jgi:DNA helicase-2/ATP-dependent DNA helicase PcrA
VNRLRLSVAGSRKTQYLVDLCTDESSTARRLVITYTMSGQAEISRRLGKHRLPPARPAVMGWYAFLLKNFVKPFVPLVYPGARVRGFDFHTHYSAIRYRSGSSRFIDDQGRAFRATLSKFADDCRKRSDGAAIDRLERMYDEILLDEVQDLTGCDLHILESLLKSRIRVVMVGDVRQSVFDTNPQDPNLSQFRGLQMVDWFEKQQKAGRLRIERALGSWRFNQEVADLSDRIFPPELGLGGTISLRRRTSGHNGVFAVHPADVDAYLQHVQPVCLRGSSATAKGYDLPFRNFGAVKGLTFEHVLIFPTGPIEQFLLKGNHLKDRPSFGLYVAVTRAEHSVAFVLKSPQQASFPTWTPL